jgi:hypothetical protein
VLHEACRQTAEWRDLGLDVEISVNASVRQLDRSALAGDVAAALVILCRGLIRGLPWEVALDRAKRGRSQTTAQALDIDNKAPLSPGGYAPEGLRATVHFVAWAETFEGCLAESLAFAGPANYSPVLVGIIGAVRWGASSIPAKMLAHCEVLLRVVQTSEALAQGWM